MGDLKWRILILMLILPLAWGYTDPRDVYAINDMYSAMGKPLLVGWVLNGGDPCLEAWEGVQCVNSNITGLVLNGAGIGGVLGNYMNLFTSMIAIDLSNNRISGTIPLDLPSTIRNFNIAGNQLVGSIPDSLTSLTQLATLNLSHNNLSGSLPPSAASLNSLTILHLEDNQLSGTLDVLQDLPLSDLNIENNIFSGPIPEKLLTIPFFKKDGNPFNTTVILSPAAPPELPPLPTFLSPPAPYWVPAPAGRPSIPPPAKNFESPAGNKSYWTTRRILWIAGILVCTFFASGLLICVIKSSKKRKEAGKLSECHEKGSFERTEKVLKLNTKGADKILKDESMIDIKPEEKQGKDFTSVVPHPLPFEKVIVNPTFQRKVTSKSPTSLLKPPTSMQYFTVASLQQYTNSFSQENRMGGCMLGSVYCGQLPDGKLLAIKKLDTRQSNEEFLELVSNISKICHNNIVKLEGYCMEHEQQILVYEYCSNGALHGALHFDNEHNEKLSWNSRIQMALGAARALEYLHEVCQPPIVHRRFMSSKILLDENLEVHVSDCGMASLISSGSVSQMSSQLLSTCGYSAPEYEMGTYTWQSDVYSFGVVMLEFLTGRKAFDRSRPRGEQFLVRWAIPRLHDIDLLSKMVDPYLNGAYPAKSLSRFADIISLCVQSEPEFRPPMSEIVQNILHMMPKEH